MKTALLCFITASALFAGTVNYTYDTAGRLTKADYGSAGSIAYEYDKAGNLIKRTVVGPVAAPASPAEKAKPEDVNKNGRKAYWPTVSTRPSATTQ
jgi:YD repeat-containing protein